MARLLKIFQIYEKCSDEVLEGLKTLKNNKICSEATPGWRLPAVKNFHAPHGQSAAIVEKKYFLEWSWFWIFLGKLSKSTMIVKKCSSEIDILSKVKYIGYEAGKVLIGVWQKPSKLNGIPA